MIEAFLYDSRETAAYRGSISIERDCGAYSGRNSTKAGTKADKKGTICGEKDCHSREASYGRRNSSVTTAS